jgi:hypothetical protein
MEDISNRTLALFLIAAIVVSVGGTMMVLNAAGPAGFKATGYVTTAENGTVDLRVQSALSISLNDTAIDFGTCTLGRAWTYVTSDGNGTDEHNEFCTLSSAWDADGDYLLLFNEGNILGNVTVKSSINSSAFFLHTPLSSNNDSWFKYFAEENTTNACTGNLQTTHTLFTANNTKYNLCDEFSTDYHAALKMFVDANLTSGVYQTYNQTTITFTIEQA